MPSRLRSMRDGEGVVADKRCENGHFIDESWDLCPYCPQENAEPDIPVVRPTRGVPEASRPPQAPRAAETLASLGPAGRPLYVSVDLDAFDPAYVPAVGTPEPGGLDWYEVTGLLRAAAQRHPIVMADVVELAPAEGPVAAAFTAAKLVYKLIGYALFKERLAPLAAQ